MMADGDTITRILEVFDEVGIPYAIGGSYASSVHGIPRSTNDIDIVADISAADCERLAAALGDDYYIDADVAKDAVARGTSFNIIDYETTLKMDVFVVSGDPYRRSLIRRQAPYDLAGARRPFVSAEDIVLLKLHWYRSGGEVSDRQWRDVLEVLTAQGDRLDSAYMRRQARALRVEDLLARAIADATTP